MSSVRAYHAGRSDIAHVPLHGGIWIATWLDTKIHSRGTLGGVVSDSAGKRYLMTSAHVLVDSKLNYGKVGDTVVAMTGPGKFDNIGIISRIDFKEAPAATLQALFKQKAWSKYPISLDVGLISPRLPVSYDIPGIGIPTGHTEPTAGMKVMHLGANTGRVMTGQVYLSSSTPGAPHCAGMSCSLPGDVFYVKWDSVSGTSTAGDSGSFVVQQGTRKVVGIHKGATPVGTSFCIRASAITRKLGVSFTGSAGSFGGTSPTPTTGGTTSTPIPTPSPDNPIAALIQAILDFIRDFIKGWNESETSRK